ncbi:hypothetical protein OIU77_004647 [Salix suchowensis]|uniref:Uncharacterized protein n=1 Tax=Salix suchowensis TaxID=1278906 RepID=A0ABQ9AV33_9ROSI|nr:hypothetical protein OIU77_004647 [Salix suchowensis]
MTVTRGIHSTGVKRMGGGHAHGHDEPFYLHANHMYNVDRMKYQRIKLPLAKSLFRASFCNNSDKFLLLSPFASRYSRLREHFSVTGNALAYPCLLGDRTLR